MGEIIRDIARWIFLFPLRLVVQYLPLGVGYFSARVGSFVLYLVSGERRKIMAKELAIILKDRRGDEEIREIVRRSFENFCKSEMEVLLYPILNRKKVKRMIEVTGLEHLDAALTQGKGAILLQAHFGAFQLVMPAIGFRGYSMSQISASSSVWKEVGGSITAMQRKMMEFKGKSEEKLPVRHIPIFSSLRPAFRALENNQVLGITADGGGGERAVPINFLGRRALFQQGAIDLSNRMESPILPTFIIRENCNRHRVVIEAPLKKQEDIQSTLQEFSSRFEKYVYRYPCHYTYTLYLRRSRARLDDHPFFLDYGKEK